MEFLYEYGLFSAKLVTMVVCAVAGLGFLIAIIANARKAVGKEETIEIENINNKLDDMRDALEEEVLGKAALKKLQKERKKKEKQRAKAEKDLTKPVLYVLNFEGDMQASETDKLRKAISTIVSVADPENDEVLIVLESSGGIVHNYGFAASQLARIKSRGISLTVAVDLVAASGGYMMACVADKIIAAPFAVVGSIGVLAELPNFYHLLKKHNVEIEHHTAGEFKTTLSTLAKNTDKGRLKFKEELEDTHKLFKDFVSKYRPQLAIDKIATGEIWYGSQGIELGLVDEVKTSDDYIMDKAKNSDIYQLDFELPLSLQDKLQHMLKASAKAISTSISEIISKGVTYHAKS